MNERVLNALMQLFALITDINEQNKMSHREKDIIHSLLSRQLNSELAERYMMIFEEYLDIYHNEDFERDSAKERKRTALMAMKILGICEKINEELQQKQKIYVIIQLIEFIAFGAEVSDRELEFLSSVASAFNIPESEYQNIFDFIINSIEDVHEKNKLLVINNGEECKYNDVKHICNENVSGDIFILNIPSTNSYLLRYSGEDDLYLNSQIISSDRTYTLDTGSSIRKFNIHILYYTDVVGSFYEISHGSKIALTAKDAVFTFKNSKNGIKELNLHEESGRLLAVMGGSGVGKSTLLNVLNGSLEPQSGEIRINGYNLYDEVENEKLKGVIGFVPQEDLLIEDLTVYQNLYYNARLCLDNFSEKKIDDIVSEILRDMDLWDIKDLKVGNPLKKIISGGQRKRLNIALELIREPSVLYVDEPTSGLSSVDSEVVMNLLKEQTYKGKLVVVIIHQPSSRLYKMFDSILILDKGGYQVYYGNPTEAVVYFKTRSNHANASEDQCGTCGNVDPDQVLQIIEAKVVNEHGSLTSTRKVTPDEWYELFKRNIGIRRRKNNDKEKIPENYYSIPNLLKQMRLFFTRDVLSKLANRQYLLVSLLEAPILAFILGYFTKYISGTDADPEQYTLYFNENFPAYILMSVIVSLFLGLIISSEEIIKDRRILKRESFLNLSWFSYLNSKVLIMFIISAIQTLSFVLVGNLILEIKGMTLAFWLILFTSSCFANLVGLNISSGLDSVITIYILVPFLIIPQLLFSGVIVKFDRLHPGLTSEEYVPVIGELMVSRWAYEAMAVHQFKNNKYGSQYFNVELEISQSDWFRSGLYSHLKKTIDYCNAGIGKDEFRVDFENKLYKIKNSVGEMSKIAGKDNNDLLSSINPHDYDIEFAGLLKLELDSLKVIFSQKNYNSWNKYNSLGTELDKANYRNYARDLMFDHHNEKLKQSLQDRIKTDRLKDFDRQIVQNFDPIYKLPASNYGRAHFYAPVKFIGKKEIDTFWFNIIAIWIYSLFFYITLYFDLLRKILNYRRKIKLRKSSN